ncbi:hypothetical protein CXB51_022061 [Gossypium anomalum]|uniref:Uncharacterized protein n=1 Tax=Gossypium anomalum TaxID=47600 RepID=A0A8J5YDQ1_9ROSI|nr:hypothetical protein CXB51_022061 [Gossypium anomalum]
MGGKVKCIITFEDIALQLSLPVDEPIITGLAVIPGKVDLYKALLWTVPDKFEVGDAGHQGVVGSVRDDGNARARPSVTAVQVEATNSATTTRPERAAQGGHAREEQRRLGATTRGTHRGLGALTNKPYLLSLDKRRRKIQRKMQRRQPQQQHRRGRV